MKKQILSEELKRMKRLAGIITESQYNKLIEENYSLKNFINDFKTAEFFEPFWQAVVNDKNNVGLDMNKPEDWAKIISPKDWTKIMSMDRQQLRNTFGLTMGTAIKLYNALQDKIKYANKLNDFNTVDGRAASLNDFFNQPYSANKVDYAEFKAMNDHFINGGEIENLEPKLKNIYMSKYKPFTKEQFMEIFKKVNINENIDEARYGRGSVDPWADIETGGEYSKSKERVSASYKRQKEEDSLGSTSYQSFTNKIKRLGNLMTDDEAVEMMDDMKRMLSQDEIMDVYNFVDRNNISSPIYTYLDQYKGETGSYGLEENGGFDIEKTKQPVDLSQYDLEPLKQKFLRMHGEIPTDEELRNIISVMKLEEAQYSEDVMIQEGQLGRTIAKMLIEEMLKEEEIADKTLIDNIKELEDKGGAESEYWSNNRLDEEQEEKNLKISPYCLKYDTYHIWRNSIGDTNLQNFLDIRAEKVKNGDLTKERFERFSGGFDDKDYEWKDQPNIPKVKVSVESLVGRIENKISSSIASNRISQGKFNTNYFWSRLGDLVESALESAYACEEAPQIDNGKAEVTFKFIRDHSNSLEEKINSESEMSEFLIKTINDITR